MLFSSHKAQWTARMPKGLTREFSFFITQNTADLRPWWLIETNKPGNYIGILFQYRTPVLFQEHRKYQLYKYNKTSTNVQERKFIFSKAKTHFLFYHGATVPSRPRPPHYRGFTITPRHTALGRTPLDDWSARRRNFYLTTHNTHNRRITLVEF